MADLPSRDDLISALLEVKFLLGAIIGYAEMRLDEIHKKKHHIGRISREFLMPLWDWRQYMAS